MYFIRLLFEKVSIMQRHELRQFTSMCRHGFLLTCTKVLCYLARLCMYDQLL